MIASSPADLLELIELQRRLHDAEARIVQQNKQISQQGLTIKRLQTPEDDDSVEPAGDAVSPEVRVRIMLVECLDYALRVTDRFSPDVYPHIAGWRRRAHEVLGLVQNGA